MPPRMPTSPCGSGSCSSRSCTGKQVTTVYETLERPMVPVLKPRWRWPASGSTASTLARMSNAFAQKMAQLEEEIHAAGRREVQRRLAQAAGRDPVRQDGPARAARPARPAPMPPAPTVLEDLAAEGHDLPARVLDWRQVSEAEIDLYRRAAGAYQPRDRAGPYLLFHRRGQYRAAGLDRSEPAEHPGPHRGRPPHPRGFRGRAEGKVLVSLDYSPDRAAHPRPCRRHPGAEAGVPRRAGHPRA